MCLTQCYAIKTLRSTSRCSTHYCSRRVRSLYLHRQQMPPQQGTVAEVENQLSSACCNLGIAYQRLPAGQAARERSPSRVRRQCKPLRFRA